MFTHSRVKDIALSFFAATDPAHLGAFAVFIQSVGEIGVKMIKQLEASKLVAGPQPLRKVHTLYTRDAR